MTDRELMQQALDALEGYARNCKCEGGGAPCDAAEALRARIAQPEPDDGYCQACEGNHCTAKNGCVARDNPPLQREWQGLTVEEVKQLWKDTPQLVGVYSYTDIAREVEAKLKEKNT